MGKERLITLKDGYRTIGDVELICAFEILDSFGKYIIYTKNEKDSSGNTIIYAGRIITIDDKQFLENIEEGLEWERLKKIMKAMAKYSLEGEVYV